MMNVGWQTAMYPRANANTWNAPHGFQPLNRREAVATEMQRREKEYCARRGHGPNDEWLLEQEKIVTDLVDKDAASQERAINLHHESNAIAVLQNSLRSIHSIQCHLTQRNQVAAGYPALSPYQNFPPGYVHAHPQLPPGYIQQPHYPNLRPTFPNVASMEFPFVPPVAKVAAPTFSDIKTPAGKRNRFEKLKGTPINSASGTEYSSESKPPARSLRTRLNDSTNTKSQPIDAAALPTKQGTKRSRSPTSDTEHIKGVRFDCTSETEEEIEPSFLFSPSAKK